MNYRLVEHSEDADIDDPISETTGGTLGAASSSSSSANEADSKEQGIPRSENRNLNRRTDPQNKISS